MYIDSHTHFDLILEEGGESEESVLDAMHAAAVTAAVQIGIDLERSIWSREFARRHGNRGIMYTMGIHPSSPAQPEDIRTIEEAVASRDHLLFGIGECGLDFYRMRQPREAQRDSFLMQASIARRYGLPLIVHSRDAVEETIACLRESGARRGIIHCFSGGKDEARAVLDLGFHISFAGNVTYRNASRLHEAARYVPADRILAETDAPFLTPVPLRGRSNRPAYLRYVVRCIAQLRKVHEEDLASDLSENFKGLLLNEARAHHV